MAKHGTDQDSSDDHAHRLRALTESARHGAARMQDAVSSVSARRDAIAPIDVALRLHERDIDAVGSVLGSALAFRLFLFFVPVLLTFAGLLQFAIADVDATTVAQHAGVRGSIAVEIEHAIDESGTGRWVAVTIGAVGALWAGRALTKVLVAVSTLAWGVDRPRRAPTIRVIGIVVGLVTAMVIAFAVVNRVRLAAGPGVATVSLVAVGIAYGVVWFILSLVLPKGTNDPSALLPGAALVGIVMGGLQWFTQLYAPDKLASASSLYGAFGITVVTLGSFFIVGRLFVAATVANAVVWERFGSIAGFVFALPGIRAIPVRLPAVARFFDIEPRAKDEDPAGDDQDGPDR